MPRDKFYYSAYNETKTFSRHGMQNANSTGFGAATGDYMEHCIDLNEELVTNKPATFFMRVNSDAMRNSGIYKDDIVVVDRSLKAATGKVIIALLHGEMLIRRFEKNNNKIRLLADSDKLAPVNIDADM